MSLLELPPLGLYIHLPWCERKCPYCDFNSHEATQLPEQAYVDALLADLEQQQDLAQGRSISTLFIGGGTPSLFSVAALERLLQGVARIVQLAPDLEATMEANPGSAEADKFLGFRAAGINRLSLGIQSFDDRQLQALGRVHSSDQAHAAITMAQAAGFDNYNLDLMHGLPGQDISGALVDIRTALDYQPPHLSWYQLTIEPNTVFHKRPPILPVEDALASIQDQGERALAAGGYRAYEVSAWSQAGHQCRHNLNYWEFGDYLAIGAGAHGKISFPDGRIRRFAKFRQPEQYMSATASHFTASSHELDAAELPGEFMLNALRLHQGFTLAGFSARTGLPASVLQTRLSALVERELLERKGEQITATALGRRFLDTVIADFLPD